MWRVSNTELETHPSCDLFLCIPDETPLRRKTIVSTRRHVPGSVCCEVLSRGRVLRDNAANKSTTRPYFIARAAAAFKIRQDESFAHHAANSHSPVHGLGGASLVLRGVGW
jgi:hypothetical protein